MERPRQLPQIKEVLQACIGHIKLDHRLKFLGDGALRCVAEQMRLPEIQQLRLFNLHRPWHNDISESEIKLQRQMRISQSPINTNPDTVIILIECDCLTLYALRIESHPVIRNFHRQALPDDFDKIINRFRSAP
jgi:hypothetical protein